MPRRQPRSSVSNWTGPWASVVFDGGSFYDAGFSAGRVNFYKARFSGEVSFWGARFSGGFAWFGETEFSGGTVDFTETEFSGGVVDFEGARFTGGRVDFSHAWFTGGQVDFSAVDDWSHPPTFPWTGTPPPGVKLPKAEDQPKA